METITLDLTKNDQINKAILLLDKGYKIYNYGLNLIVLIKTNK